MSCNIQSETIGKLRKDGLIGEKRIVKDYTAFEEMNAKLSKKAYDKYQVGDGHSRLFSTRIREYRDLQGNYKRNITFDANTELFKQLDEAVYEYRKQHAPHLLVSAKTKEAHKKLFNGKERVSVKETLETISKSKHKLAPLAKFFQERMEELDDIDIVVVNNQNVDWSGMYERGSENIMINTAIEPRSTVETTIIHELIHYLSATTLGDYSATDTKQMEALYDQAAKYLPKDSYYAMKDLDEFTVGVFTDSKLIKELKKIPPVAGHKKGNNLFQQILNYLLEVIGLPKGESLFEQAFQVASEVIHTNVMIKQRNKASYQSFQQRNQGMPLYDRGQLGTFAIEGAGNAVGNRQDSETYESIFSTPDKLIDKSEQAENEKGDIKYKELGDIHKKIEQSIIDMSKTLDVNIERYQDLKRMYARQNKVSLSDYMSTKEDELNSLKEKINSYHKSHKIRGVVAFTQRMINQIKYIEKKLNEVDETDQKEIFYTLRNYDALLKTFGVVEQLQKNLAEIRQDNNQTLLDKEQLNKIEELVSNAKSKHDYLTDRMFTLKKKHLRYFLNDIKYFEELQYKHRERLRKEHTKNKIAEDFDTWAARMMHPERGRDRDLIQEDLDKVINSLLEDPSFDIGAASRHFNTAINTSSDLVQIYNKIITERKNKRLDFERAKDREFKTLFEKVLKEYGGYNPAKIFDKILEKDSNGKPFIIGEYKIGLLELKKERYELTKKLKQLTNEKKFDTQEYKDIRARIHEIDGNFHKVNGEIVPIDKWKNDLSKLSPLEKEMRDFFIEVSEFTRKETFGKASIVHKFNGATFYDLPKISKSDTERLWTGSFTGTVKDKWTDLRKIKPDDVGFRKVDVDGSGNPINSIPIHYRDSYNNPMPVAEQSIDLFNLFRLEYKNGVMFKVRKETEMEENMLLEMVGEKDFYKSYRNRDRRTGQIETKDGKESNTYKMMVSMMESSLYDIMHKHGGTLSGIDANKAVGFINGITAFLGMSFNITSGVANVVNAKAQIFLESFIKGHYITAKGVKKASQIYQKHLIETTKDNTRPINDSFVNQVNELFDVKGLFNLSDADFMKTNLVKLGLSREALQVFQSSGEHWIQSTITMAVLDGIKVMNKDGNFINKEGKVVNTKKEAASLLDMLERDDKGLVQVSDKVVYTTHSVNTKWNEGGKANVDMLIRKKIFDSVGAYTQDTQPDAKKHWWGKLMLMYRSYFVPMGIARLKGIESAHKRKEDLREDEKNFNYAIQEYEEGTYTTLARYMITSLKEGQYNLLSKDNWSELTEYEKHNIKRAVVELVLSFALIPLILMGMEALADDDDELFYFIMYQVRRLDTELSQYRDPRELFKIMRSPIPAARTLETAISTVTSIITFDVFEEYESGDFEGYNKTLIKTGKQFPVLKDILRSYQDLYEFQNSNWGTGL